MAKTYVVVQPFIDTQDGHKKYYAGDVYTGSKSAKRIKTLTTNENDYGYPFLSIDEEEETKEGE